MENLLSVLSEKAPAKADAVSRNRRDVQHGRLSVGLKLHIIQNVEGLEPLITELGKREGRGLNPNSYRLLESRWCAVLEALGNANAAVDLLLAIEQYCEMPVFMNPKIHLQVCSPGRLTPELCAIANIAFYLNSDTLRRYDLQQLTTTFSRSDFHPRAKRIMLYDADGYFDQHFAWWSGAPPNHWMIEEDLPFEKGRTDILVGPGSAHDIRSINLIMTLLVHSQYNGYWKKLGDRFIEKMLQLLRAHDLLHLLDPPWIRIDGDARTGRDDVFYPALQELVAYAFGEAVHVRVPPKNTLERVLRKVQWRYIPPRTSNDLLREVRSTLIDFNHELLRLARLVHTNGSTKR